MDCFWVVEREPVVCFGSGFDDFDFVVFIHKLFLLVVVLFCGCYLNYAKSCCQKVGKGVRYCVRRVRKARGSLALSIIKLC